MDNLKQYAEEMLKYYQENQNLVVGIAVGLVIFIVIILLIRQKIVEARMAKAAALKRQELAAQKLEEERLKQIEEQKQQAEQKQQEEQKQQDALQAAEAEEPTKDASLDKATLEAAEDLVKGLIKANKISANQLESIEIKIENAIVTLNYMSGEKKAIIIAEEGDRNKPVEAKKPEQTVTVPESMIMENDLAGEQGQRKQKFGQSNQNVGQSGHIYTEEELCQQIKD